MRTFKPGAIGHFLVWLLVAAYVVAVIWLAGGAGLRMRQATWETTRTIRFNGDIANGFQWGGRVCQVARQESGTAEPTLWQLIRAEGRVYRDLVQNAGTENYGLDYPPFRLLTMALWRRHVDRQFPSLAAWPAGAWPGQRPERLGVRATEDIAAPLLAMNTSAEALTAVLGAGLVGLWVWRGHPGRRRRADGVLLFIVTSGTVFYALRVAVMPSAPPPPSVTITGPPSVYATTGAKSAATLFAVVNAQGASARCYVEWGLLAGHYTRASTIRSVDGTADTDLSIDLIDLPLKTAIHYRIVARNDGSPSLGGLGRGSTKTDDAVFVTDDVVQPPQPRESFGRVWLDVWQWAGVAAVFVAMCWSIRQMDAGHRAWASALVTGVLIWFDPTMLVDAHIWPQWDVWLLPPFLLAALLASLDCWLMAGMVMGFGMMFKGQFLIGSPVLIIWPLVGLRWNAAARLVVGFVLMAGLLVSPWLVLASRPPMQAPKPLWWIAGVLAATTIGIVLSLWRGRVWGWSGQRLTDARRRWTGWRRTDVAAAPEAVTGESQPVSLIKIAIACGFVTSALASMVLMVFRPWPADAELSSVWGVVLLGAILVAPWVLPRRSLGTWVAAVLGVSIWCSAALFHGDWSWKTVGYEYGTKKFEQAAIGHGTNGNLPLILNERFGWNIRDPAISLRMPNLISLLYAGDTSGRVPRWMHRWYLDGVSVTLDFKQTLMLVYVCILIACGVGAAVHSRRRDTRFLAAMVAPWVLMPHSLCQMMNRYHLWGAVLAALLVGVMPELALLYVVFTLLAAGMIGSQLLLIDRSRSPHVVDLITRISPDSGWVMLAGALIVLFLALTPGRRYGSGRSLRS